MSYPQPQGPDLVDRTKQDLQQTTKKVGGFFKKYSGGQYQLYWTYGIVLLCGVIYGIYWVGTKIRYEFLGGKQELAKARYNTADYWVKGEAGTPVPLELNGDGTTDFVGGYSGLDPKGDYVGAFDGKTGNVIWRVGPLKFGVGPTLHATKDKLLIVSFPQDLQLVDLKTGKQLRTAKAPHAIREICPDPSGKDRVVLKNYRQYTELDLSTLATSTGDESWCGRQPHPGIGTALDGAPLPDGMRTGRAIEDPAGNRYFTGSQQVPGGNANGVPVLIASDKDGKRLWRKTYASKVPPLVAFAGGRVYAVSRLSSPTALIAYEAKTGKELWKNTEVKLLTSSSVVASKDAVYVQVGRGLCVFDPKDGKLKAVLGDETAF
ncbi:MAG: PQQ-binding-like beta-propeller repeat protein [Polyangiaceae bacterium]